MKPLQTLRWGGLLSIIGGLMACAPLIHPPGHATQRAYLTQTHFITQDGAKLPYRSWLPAGEPKAVLIALHGFNDYSHFFDKPGRFFAGRGIACFAYDQRGFGGSPNRGLWSGIDAYVSDLHQFAQLIAERYPELPLHVLGESMGGAVVIVAAAGHKPLPANGVILAAPAVWGRNAMPWYQRLLLWLTAHSVPWMTVTGERLDIVASDNIEMLRALGRDPMVIKETRIETVYGLANLMDEAFEKSAELNRTTLLLYGEKDELIPKPPTVRMLRRLPQRRRNPKRYAFYENGYHMLLRDHQAPILYEDIAAWIEHPEDPLPSGADQRAVSALTTGRSAH